MKVGMMTVRSLVSSLINLVKEQMNPLMELVEVSCQGQDTQCPCTLLGKTP